MLQASPVGARHDCHLQRRPYEAMMAFHDPADIRRFAAWYEREASGAQPYIASPPGVLRDVAEGVLLWIAFEL